MIPAFPFCPYLFNLFLTLHVRLGYELPWEDAKFVYPNNMAPPLEIAIEASNGASDYGNKFGEPVLAGFARSFGMMLPNGERREWVKPIMFSGGIGMIDGEGVTKLLGRVRSGYEIMFFHYKIIARGQELGLLLGDDSSLYRNFHVTFFVNNLSNLGNQM